MKKTEEKRMFNKYQEIILFYMKLTLNIGRSSFLCNIKKTFKNACISNGNVSLLGWKLSQGHSGMLWSSISTSLLSTSFSGMVWSSASSTP